MPKDKGPYELKVLDVNGVEVYRTVVDIKMPRPLGWNLQYAAGREQLSKEIKEALEEHEQC